MSEFRELDKYLSTNPGKTYLVIIDHETGQLIDEKITHEDLSSYDNSVEKYIKSLGSIGVVTVRVEKKAVHPNGPRNTGAIVVKIPKTSVVEENRAKSQNVNSPVQQQQQPQVQQQQQNTTMMQPQSQAQEVGMFGANPDYIRHLTKSERFDELKMSFNELRKEHKELREKYDQIKEENLEFKIGSGSKPSTVDRIIESFANNPQLAGVIAEKFAGGGASTGMGLNAPSNLSEKARALVQNIINDTPQDDIIDRLFLLVQKYQNGDNEFITLMEKQFEKHAQPQAQSQQTV